MFLHTVDNFNSFFECLNSNSGKILQITPIKSYVRGPVLLTVPLEMRDGPVGRTRLLTASDVNCDCRECDSTDPHCVPRELQLFPGFDSVQCRS